MNDNLQLKINDDICPERILIEPIGFLVVVVLLLPVLIVASAIWLVL